MNTGAQSIGKITTNFSAVNCLVEPQGSDPTRVARLFSQFDTATINCPSTSLFQVQVDRKGGRKNDLQITYDPDRKGPIILGWARRSTPPMVSESPDEVFTFTGQSGSEIRVGEDEGNDRIRIFCPGKGVVVTVDARG